MTSRPPRLPTRLLDAVLPPGPVGASIVGDLVEEWSRRPAGLRRTLWYAGAALALAARYGPGRAVAGVVVSLRGAASSFRRLGRHPLQTSATVVALGVGIAAPATMYSIVAGATREIDVEEPDRLVHVGKRMTPTIVQDARLDWLWPGLAEVDGFESLGIYGRRSVDLSGPGGEPERREMGIVTPGVFEALRVGTAVGRAFAEDDARQAPPPVVLGWELWQRRYGGDPAALGRTVRVDGHPRTVIGVMPEEVRYPGGVDLWTALDPADPALADLRAWEAVGRLAPGASLEAVRERVHALDGALRARGDTVPPSGGLAAQPWSHRRIGADDRRMLRAMIVVAGFVLLIACADVLNLLLARALGRSRETAVRVALGAGRWRVVGEHLAEASALAILGGLVGLGLTAAAVRTFEVQTAGFVAYWMDFGIDLPVLLFGVALVAVTALATGLVPALQSGRLDPGASLRDGGRGASAFRVGRLSRALVAGEVALSCTLLVVAAITVRGAVVNLRTDGDYATDDVLTASYELRPDVYRGDPELRAFHRALVERLRERPEVAGAALVSELPGVFAVPRRVELEGRRYDRPEDRPTSHVVVASPELLGTLGSGVSRGRELRWGDGVDGPAAVLVNEEFVRTRMDGADPLGARVRVRYGPGPEGGAPVEWSTVVGVVPQLGVDVGRDVDGVGIYVPVGAEPIRRMKVLVRAAAGVDPLSLADDVREVVGTLDPDLALYEVDSLAGHIRETRIAEAVFAALFLLFGVAGVLLASVGLYGLLSFTVRRRLRELGVRTALGAAPARVLWSAGRQGLAQLGAGLVAGLALAALGAPLLGELLLGMDPRDPTIYGAVAGILAVVGLLAIALPARRALAVDVVEVLRSE